MSNPLAIFRKHQKVLLAVFGVALMFAFTIGPIILQWMGPGTGGVENSVVVRLPSGNLRESDIQSLRNSRMYLLNFMRRINGLAAQQGATPKQTLGIPDSVDERSLVRTVVLSEKAREMGVVISDETIIAFLEQYTDGILLAGDFARELQTISGGRMSQTQFFDAMRGELLAIRFMDLFQRGLFQVTPAASWDYYQRLNRQVKIQAVPFPVEKHLSEVSEPTEQEIEALYGEAKDRFPFPSAPDPGFRRRKKVALQYVQADLEKFLNEEMAKITDDEIEQYYNDNKEKFRNLDLPTENDFNLTPQETDPTTLDSTEEVDSSADTELVPDADLPDLEDLDADPTGDTTTDGDTELSPSETSEPADEEPASDNPDGAALGRLQTSFVALQETEESEDAEPTNTESEANNELPIDELPVEQASEPEASPDTEPTKQESDDTAAEATESDLDDLGILPDDDDTPAPEEKRPEYRPLEDVAEEIRNELATLPAVQRMDDAVRAVQSEMKKYQGAYIVWQVPSDEEATDPPPPPNLQALASQHGLTAGTIPEVDIVQLLEADPITGERRYPISEAYQRNGVSFGQQAFGSDLLKYQVREIPGPMRDITYLYWKTDEVPESTPELEDCRSEVIKALKMKAALPKAQQEAEAAVAQLRTSNQSPKDAFRNSTDHDVIEAGPLSWMKPADLPYMAPELTRIPGIKFAGPDFMRSVFSLRQGEAGVTTDNPQANAYLVYLDSDESDLEKMRNDFYRAGYTFEIAQLGLQDSQQTVANWYSDYAKALGVQWERDPESDERRR